jgi:hypothetical protein
MKTIVITLMLLIASAAFAQNADPNDANNTKGTSPKDPKSAKGADASAYKSPYDSDISKSSFGTGKGAFLQGSVTNASPQHASGTPAPTIDFHHKDAHASSTTHAAKPDAKAVYDPGQYKAKAPAKPGQ